MAARCQEIRVREPVKKGIANLAWAYRSSEMGTIASGTKESDPRRIAQVEQ